MHSKDGMLSWRSLQRYILWQVCCSFDWLWVSCRVTNATTNLLVVGRLSFLSIRWQSTVPLAAVSNGKLIVDSIRQLEVVSGLLTVWVRMRSAREPGEPKEGGEPKGSLCAVYFLGLSSLSCAWSEFSRSTVSLSPSLQCICTIVMSHERVRKDLSYYITRCGRLGSSARRKFFDTHRPTLVQYRGEVFCFQYLFSVSLASRTPTSPSEGGW